MIIADLFGFNESSPTSVALPQGPATPSYWISERGWKKDLVYVFATSIGAFLGHIAMASYVYSRKPTPCIHTYRPVVLDGKLNFEFVCETQAPKHVAAVTRTVTVTETETKAIPTLIHQVRFCGPWSDIVLTEHSLPPPPGL